MYVYPVEGDIGHNIKKSPIKKKGSVHLINKNESYILELHSLSIKLTKCSSSPKNWIWLYPSTEFSQHECESYKMNKSQLSYNAF